ncbi:MAG: PD-(D/E)XK nuclease family protein, partial [Nitrospinales bacterium]
RNLLKREFAAELTPETVFPWREKEPPLNISYAGPLAQEPLVQLALLILSAPSEAIPLLNLSALLESSFLSGGQSEAPQRKSLDLKLRRKKIVTFYLNQAKDFIDRREAPIFFSILSSWRQLIGERAKKSPGDWARYFSQFLKKIGWPMGNGALTSRTNEVYEAWKDCLDSFASLSKLLGPVTRLQAALTLSQLAEEKPYQPKSSQKPIQVVGLQDSPGMTFDHLWLMGSHEDVLPARPFLNSFLPVEIQKKYGLPHSSANWELQFAERSLARLVDSAQSVIISFPAWDESKELRISPLLKSLTQPHPLPEISQSHKLVDQLHMHSKLETWMDPQEIPLTTQEKTIFKEDGVPGGQQVLKNQAACPFKAFAIHRLHTEKIEAPEEVFDPAERGQLVHKALELFWREVKSRKFLKILSQNGELKDTIENCVKNTMDKNSGFRKLKFQPRFAQLEFDRMVLLLTQWMDIELLRSDFEVLEIEKKEVIHISDLSLNVRIDRVDKVAGDKILLIDYKTGDVV